jgi:ribosomal protein L9
MDIILLERVEKLGAIGDVVTVQTKLTARFSKLIARKLKAITQPVVMKRKRLRAVSKVSRSF